MFNLIEKRRFPRIDLKTPIRCQIRGSGNSVNTVSRDLGLGGIGFVNHAFIPTNTYVNLEINLLSRIINPIGRIVRINSLPHTNKFNLGVEFTELELEQKKFLSDYIDMRLGKL